MVGRKDEDPVQKSDSHMWYEHSWRVDFASEYSLGLHTVASRDSLKLTTREQIYLICHLAIDRGNFPRGKVLK